MGSISNSPEFVDYNNAEEALKQPGLGEMPDLTEEEYEEKLREILVGRVLESHNLQMQPFNLADVLLYLYFVFMGIIVFFGYKLYRSQTEKERKREEKRKQKQQKKKHK